MNLVGNNVAGYNFIEFINEGGFGSVYKAEKDGKFFAIKLFREAYVLKEYRKGDDNRISNEIEIIQKARHPNLIEYVDHFEAEIDDSKHHFLVMEFIEGSNLRAIIENEGNLKEERAIPIFKEVLAGLNALHNLINGKSSGVIHRDLKPENILIEVDGSVKIVDFGISKIIDFTSITSTGEVFGTGPYMSPEQITDSKNIDRRSDLYTAGVVLYEMLTGDFPYDFQSAPELAEKIKSEPPTPPRRKVQEISNSVENVILKLLEKQPYERFTDVTQVIESLDEEEIILTEKNYNLDPRFILRLWDDKSVLSEFLPTYGPQLPVEFPANLASNQKGLLELVQGKKTPLIIDPCTLRLAYDTYAEVKGLVALSYSRDDFQPITPEYLSDYKTQREYVKKVIDTEAELGADILVSPFHYTHNTNVALTTKNRAAEWLDLDIKLLMESIDYKKSKPELSEKKLYAGICLHHTSINDERDRKYILNTFSLFDCDGYIVYIDTISNESSRASLFSYIQLLTELQKATGKPVIAGRVGPLGFGLLCAGIAGFTSGTARFETFYEDLYKETGPAYKLYERYYYPELLSTIPISKKDPTKLDSIAEFLPPCACDYCKGKSATDVIHAKNNKLHFLRKYTDELDAVYRIPPEERKAYFLGRIKNAIDNYAKLSPSVFAPSDYKHLISWQEVFERLQ